MRNHAKEKCHRTFGVKMNRPMYETREDVSREWAVAEALGRAWNKEPVKLPKAYPCDIMMNGPSGPACFVEIKCRNIAWYMYPSLHISVQKVAHLMTLGEATMLPVYIAVQMDDCLLTHKIAHPYPITLGGRRDREDPDDVEPVFEISFDLFREVN